MSRSESTLRRRPTGSEPGINPRGGNTDSDFVRSRPCLVEVMDYSTQHVASSRFSNADFLQFLEEQTLEEEKHEASLRWINVGGISWDILSTQGLIFVDIHSLALEDMLLERGHSHSKADYYQQHLFLRVLCHSLPTEEERQNSGPNTETKFPGYSGPLEHNDAEKVVGLGSSNKSKNTHLSGFYLTSRQQQILRILSLSKGDRMIVKHDPMFIFLLRDGTVISIHPNPNLQFTEPVVERMHRYDSLLRTSEDPAMIVEALLDLIVDRIVEVMDKYQEKIQTLERDILAKPGMSTVRSLHILSGDLIMHRRSLEPIKSLIYGLRTYDQDRCTALGFGNDLSTSQKQVDADRHGSDAGLGVGVGANHGKVWGREGYMSYKSKIYLADVYDHMDFVLTSLEMFAGISENLINYAFNTASYEMNQVMRRLTLATIIFLPLTLLTGYFGMNFTAMWSVNNNSDLLFWIIALPLMGIVVPMFLYQDIKQALHYMQKAMAARKVVLAEKRASRNGLQLQGVSGFHT